MKLLLSQRSSSTTKEDEDESLHKPKGERITTDHTDVLDNAEKEEEVVDSTASSRNEDDDDDDNKSSHSLPLSWKLSSTSSSISKSPSGSWTMRRSNKNKSKQKHKLSKKKLPSVLNRHLSWKPQFQSLVGSSSSSKSNKTLGAWRQRRRIRSMAHDIQAQVEQRIQQAPFLLLSHNKQSSSLSGPPIIRRKDLTLGVLLGYGAFSEVYEVTLQQTKSKNSNSNSNHDLQQQDKNQQQQKKLVWKHLKPTTILISSSSKDNFCQAAVDLRMEALYLSKLQHDNIIALHGIVVQSQSQSQSTLLPYSDGRYNGYGLLLEPLLDTLEDRLMDWKRLLLLQEHDDDSQQGHVQPEEERDHSRGRHGKVDFTTAQLALLSQYALQIASALQYLHSHRIVMCDVKPSNVGFVNQHTVKLFDFGLCRDLPADEDDGDNTNSHHQKLYTLPVAGTPTYLPGEVLCRQKYNCLADVYAWAMVVYELFTLEKPYHHLTSQEHLERVGKQGERPVLTPVPKCFQALLPKAWEHNVYKRWSMEEVVKEFKGILEREHLLEVDTTYADPMHHYHHRRSSSSTSMSGFPRSLSSAVEWDRADSVVSDNTTTTSPTATRATTTAKMTADDFEQFFCATHSKDDYYAMPTTSSASTRKIGSGRVKSKSWSKLSWGTFKSSLVPPPPAAEY